ncbi:MAG: hypothetical protein ACTSU5_02780, partial [Promethearchaeota archaeon]
APHSQAHPAREVFINPRAKVETMPNQGKAVAWVTTLGWSPMAVVNTIWAFVKQRGLFPSTVCVLFEDKPTIRKNFVETRAWLEELARVYAPRADDAPGFDLREVTLADESLEVYADALDRTVGELEAGEVYLDVTPGRKFMSMLVGAYGLGHQPPVRGIFYNHLYDSAYLDSPLPHTPRQEYRLRDIRDYAGLFDGSARREPAASKVVLTTEECADRVLEYLRVTPGLSKSKIRKALAAGGFVVNGQGLRESLRNLEERGLVVRDTVEGAATGNYEVYRARGAVAGNVGEGPRRGHDPRGRTLSPDGLVVLLNRLHELGYGEVSVQCAPLGMEAFTFTLERRARVSVNKDNLGRQSGARRGPPEIPVPAGLRWEVEVTNPWRDLLVMAGILPPDNLGELLGAVTGATRYNPLEGDLPTVICLDTNLFRHRFYTLLTSRAGGGLDGHRVGFLIADKVRDELHFHHKYSGADVEKLVEFSGQYCLPGPAESDGWFEKVCGEFFNQNKLVDRKLRLGFVELQKCLRSERTFNCSHGGGGADPDGEIIKSVAGFLEKRNLRALLLSEDRDFVARARGIPRVTPSLVTYPYKNDVPDVFDVPWSQLAQLLYCTATWFGGVVLVEVGGGRGGTGGSGSGEAFLSLNGIWKGKDGRDWEGELVLVGGGGDLLDEVFAEESLIRRVRERLAGVNSGPVGSFTPNRTTKLMNTASPAREHLFAPRS